MPTFHTPSAAAPAPPAPATAAPATVPAPAPAAAPVAVPSASDAWALRTKAYQAVIGLALAVFLAVGYWYLLTHLPAAVDLLFLVVVLFGGGGGVLFAVREGSLIAPQFRLVRTPRAGADAADEPEANYVIQLGWVGDALFGIAGAATIFLLIPGLSENADATMQELQARNLRERANGAPAPVAADAPAAIGAASPAKVDAQRGTDFLELIAVSLIGGFGGRAVLRSASDRLLQQEVRRMEAGVQQEQTQVRQELVQARANTRAMELSAQQLSPLLAAPTPADLDQTLAAASDDGRLRVLDYTLSRLQAEREKVARAATVLLTGLLKTPVTPRHTVVACLGLAHGYAGDRGRAVELLDAAIDLIADDLSADGPLKRYQSWREKFTDTRPAKPVPR